MLSRQVDQIMRRKELSNFWSSWKVLKIIPGKDSGGQMAGEQAMRLCLLHVGHDEPRLGPSRARVAERAAAPPNRSASPSPCQAFACRQFWPHFAHFNRKLFPSSGYNSFFSFLWPQVKLTYHLFQLQTCNSLSFMYRIITSLPPTQVKN